MHDVACSTVFCGHARARHCLDRPAGAGRLLPDADHRPTAGRTGLRAACTRQPRGLQMADAWRRRRAVLACIAGPAVPQRGWPRSRADDRVIADPVRVLPDSPDLRRRQPGRRKPRHPCGGPVDHCTAVAAVLRAHPGHGPAEPRVVDAVPEDDEQRAEQPGVLLRTDPLHCRGQSRPPRFLPDTDPLHTGLLPAGALHQHLPAATARWQLGGPADQRTVRAAGSDGRQPSSPRRGGDFPHSAAHRRCRRAVDAAPAVADGGATGRPPAADPGHAGLPRRPARLCPAQCAEPDRIQRQRDELETLARRDALTGLGNRRSFDESLGAAHRRARRQGLGLAVLMIDIDHFKRLNDTYGHPEGDRRLRAVAAILDGCLQRGDDLLARYGGEEFIAALPSAEAMHALELGERLRAAVESAALPAADGQVTISVGVAWQAAGDEREPSDLVAHADQALYRAKRDGRNCVHLAPAPGTAEAPSGQRA
ncbi:hypothetical protein G6F35_008983 [Rhizopus arrhizus]|nr:hypothetical protein G6F35_008983 [Rhizopus arrhizus]